MFESKRAENPNTRFPPNADSDMVAEWPRRQAQTKAAVKKAKPLGEKILEDIRKRTSQVGETIKPAMENSTLARNTSKEAEHIAHALVKVGVFVLC